MVICRGMHARARASSTGPGRVSTPSAMASSAGGGGAPDGLTAIRPGRSSPHVPPSRCFSGRAPAQACRPGPRTGRWCSGHGAASPRPVGAAGAMSLPCKRVIRVIRHPSHRRRRRNLALLRLRRASASAACAAAVGGAPHAPSARRGSNSKPPGSHLPPPPSFTAPAPCAAVCGLLRCRSAAAAARRSRWPQGHCTTRPGGVSESGTARSESS